MCHCLNGWSSEQRLETLWSCSTFLFANSQYLSTHFWACPPCRKSTLLFFREAFPTPIIFQLLQQKYVIRTFFCILPHISFIRFALTVSTSQIYVVNKWCWFLKINILHQVLPHKTHILLLSSHWESKNPTVHPNSMPATIFQMTATTTKMSLMTDSKCTSSQSLGQHVQILHCSGTTADLLVVEIVYWDGFSASVLELLRAVALRFWWLLRSLHVGSSDRFSLGCWVPASICFHVFPIAISDVLKLDNLEIAPILCRISSYMPFWPRPWAAW